MALLDGPFRAVLRPNELTYLTASGVRSAESAYALLESSPSLDPGKPDAGLQVRRRLLMRRLEPLLAPGFFAAVAASRRRPRGGGLGASPPSARLERVRNPTSHGGSVPFDTAILLTPPGLFARRTRRTWSGDVGLTLPGPTPGFAMAKPFTTSMAGAWPPRCQNGLPTCVAHAATACVELMRQLAAAPAANPSGNPAGNLAACAAPAAAAPFTPLSARFLYNRMRLHAPASPPPGAAQGYTKLSQARDALAQDGICSDATWGEAGPLAAAPSQAAIAEAAANRIRQSVYRDMPDPATRTPGTALLVYTELMVNRPVAIALPAFSANGNPLQPTNWTRADAQQSGEVPDPAVSDKPVPLSGHAVCVIGFQPGGADKLGGYFIFRNSEGLLFGSQAPMHDADDPLPHGPAPGYGTISAQQVEDHVWELLSLTLG